jgi:hypothetical protein
MAAVNAGLRARGAWVIHNLVCIEGEAQASRRRKGFERAMVCLSL